VGGGFVRYILVAHDEGFGDQVNLKMFNVGLMKIIRLEKSHIA